MYKSFIRPKLEFAVAARSLWTEHDSNCMEKIQRRLVRVVRALSDVRGETNEKKLRDAGLTTLKERRKRGDAIETFKKRNGLISSTKRRARKHGGDSGRRKKERNVLKNVSTRLEIRPREIGTKYRKA